MQDNRKNQRFKTTAQVHIPDIQKGENLLKDLSITGCCIECPFFTEIRLDKIYKLEIVPEVIAKIESFVLEVLPKWIRSVGDTGEVGFNVIASPKGKEFQNYVDYLAYRSAQT